PASKSCYAKSCVSGVPAPKSLIFLKWHGRGRRFEPVQVHQNVSNTRSPTTSQDVVGVQRDGSAKASFRIRTDPRKTLLSDSADIRVVVFGGDLREQRLVRQVPDGGLADLWNFR